MMSGWVWYLIFFIVLLLGICVGWELNKVSFYWKKRCYNAESLLKAIIDFDPEEYQNFLKKDPELLRVINRRGQEQRKGNSDGQ